MKPPLSTIGHLDVAALLGTIWRWWTHELLGVLPHRFVRRFFSKPNWVAVSILENDIVVEYQEDGQPWEAVAAFPKVPDIEAQPLPAIGDRFRNDAVNVVVHVRPEDILVCSMRLPAVGTKKVRQIIQHELERVCPIDPEMVLHDYAVLGHDRRKKQLEIDLRIIRRLTVDKAMILCRSMGLEAQLIGIKGDTYSFNCSEILPQEGRKKNRTIERPMTVGLLILMALLGGGTLASLYIRDQHESNRLETAMIQAKTEAGVVNRMRSEIKAEHDKERFLPLRKQSPLVSRVLSEVTRILPDGSWLFEFEINDKEVRLRGYSPAASSLIGLFDASLLFTHTRFRSPLTQGPRTDLERFDLSMDVKGEP